MEKIEYFKENFLFGVHTLDKRKIVEARIGEQTPYHSINVYNAKTNKLIGAYTKKSLLRHILLSECYLDNNQRINKNVFELELYTRKNSNKWMNKHEIDLDFEKKYISLLTLQEKKKYLKKK